VLNGVRRLLAHRGRNDLARLLQRAELELDISDCYGSYAYSQLATAEVRAPIEDYEALRRLPQDAIDVILGVLQEIRPPRENDIEIVDLVFRVDAEAVSSASMTDDELIREIEHVRDMMVSVSTGAPMIKDVNAEFRSRAETVRTALRHRGQPDPNPHEDLWSWHGKWSSGDLPTYRSRREYLSGLYEPLLRRLKGEGPAMGAATLNDPTGWPKLDRTLVEIRRRLEEATTEEQFQAVGLLCREALISLAQEVFDRRHHPPIDNVEPSRTDAKRMLESYLSVELAGHSHESARKHARAAFDLANDLQHHRTANFRQAAMCAEATTAVVNLIAIMSGRRDP
jgi:hypothetical protein